MGAKSIPCSLALQSIDTHITPPQRYRSTIEHITLNSLCTALLGLHLKMCFARPYASLALLLARGQTFYYQLDPPL